MGACPGKIQDGTGDASFPGDSGVLSGNSRFFHANRGDGGATTRHGGILALLITASQERQNFLMRDIERLNQQVHDREQELLAAQQQEHRLRQTLENWQRNQSG